MLRRLYGGMAFTLGAMAALAQGSPAHANDARVLPMQFELHREGPASACGDNCRIWVSAVGAITRDTPSDFAAFSREHDIYGATLVLDSSGGSVLGTLSLGRAIRRLAMTTTVGKIRKLTNDGTGEGRAALTPRADCESMCAFLLLAGTQRSVPPEAQVLVHEIWLGDRREDAAAATYSAEDLVLVQRDIGRLAQYTIEMGGSIDLLETALRIPPWEPMRRLSATELRRMGLDMAAAPQDAGSQAIAVSVPAPRMARAPATARGWTVQNKVNEPVLSRRHPLTIEGDEIGSFDVIFACSPAPDSYAVTYVERRRSTDTRSEPQELKQVGLSTGRRSVSLNVVSSEIHPKQVELESVAKGLVPAAFLDSLAREGNRSLTVNTSTANKVETAIRIGNTGVAQNLARLAESCAEQEKPRSGSHAELMPAQAADAGGVPRAK